VKIKKSVVILASALACLVIFSVPVFAGTTYVESWDIYQYRIGPDNITWAHTYDHSADPVATVTLTIVADDVDFGEKDEVFVNGIYVGDLNDMGYYTNWAYALGPGNPNQPLTTTTFNLDPTWLDGVPVSVSIPTAWGVEIETSTLTVTSSEAIPEFSTIALPVASILGLLFFFNNRKRKEEK
jgi:hypothetical protein